MGFLSWILFGAVAGWVASIIAGTNRRQGCLMNIIVGIAGAFVGGLISQWVFNQRIIFGFDLQSFAVAVLGAVILLVIFVRRRE